MFKIMRPISCYKGFIMKRTKIKHFMKISNSKIIWNKFANLLFLYPIKRNLNFCFIPDLWINPRITQKLRQYITKIKHNKPMYITEINREILVSKFVFCFENKLIRTKVAVWGKKINRTTKINENSIDFRKNSTK